MPHQQVVQGQPRHFEYEPLRDKRSARYMILQAASTVIEPLVCTLHSAHLDEFPAFETISYVWGIPVENQPITCNGKDTRITANLSAALRQMRLTASPRTLWVDAICINQADTQERGQQVSLMQDIYEKSHCTRICLGSSDHTHAPIVAGLVADVNFRIQSVFWRPDFDWSVNSFPIAEEDDPLLSHSGWESFSVLLQQPWFKRGWVVQEAVLSRDAVVRWADTDIDWLKLVQAYIWWTRRALKLPQIRQLSLSDLHLQGFYSRRTREAITFGPEGATRSLTILEILEYARWLDVTDPSDRIYAFMGLPGPINRQRCLLSIQPNYNEPYLEVYRDFALEYLRRFEDLDILHFVHNDESTLECEFPSWIPRWNLRIYSSYTGTLNNYGRSRRRIMSRRTPPRITVSTDKTTLGLQMMILDTVTFAGRAFIKDITTPEDVASLWKSVSIRSTPLLYSCSALRAFVEVFCCGIYRGRLKEWKALESAYMRLLQGEVCQGDVSYDDAKSFHGMRMGDVNNRCFITLGRGYYGLAPKTVQEGDICCVLFGTRSPFIVRRTYPDGHYTLVGSALILSKELGRGGNPGVLGGGGKYDDWVAWGLNEESGFLR